MSDIRIGIIGFGLMGKTHASAYCADPRATITAIADSRKDLLAEPVSPGNVAGQGDAHFDPKTVARFDSAEALLESDIVDAVSICTPTATHVETSIAALESGKHVLVEKPLALTSAEAQRVVTKSSEHPELICMPAMCMRFWPEWSWLRDAIREERYGKVRSATFTRLGAMPHWADFYNDAEQSGAAILDLHIHDADFVRFCFGEPTSVEASGYSKTTKGIDHVVTRYHFGDDSPVITAEGGWCMSDGFEFTMRYSVNFDRATAVFDLGKNPHLRIAAEGEERVQLAEGDGYSREISCFLDCIEHSRQPDIVMIADGAASVRLIEAERESALAGGARVLV